MSEFTPVIMHCPWDNYCAHANATDALVKTEKHDEENWFTFTETMYAYFSGKYLST